MNYSTTYIAKVLSKAQCCLASKAEERAIKWRGGLDCSKLNQDMMESSLYIYSLSNWDQNTDGTIPDTNILTVSQRDTLINGLLDLSCSCGNIDTQTIVNIKTDYWNDGYTDNDDESNLGAYIA